MNPTESIHLSAETYPNRQHAADSAALYEAVNAYVEELAVARWNMPRINDAHHAFLQAARIVAHARYEQRRADRGEGQP